MLGPLPTPKPQPRDSRDKHETDEYWPKRRSRRRPNGRAACRTLELDKPVGLRAWGLRFISQGLGVGFQCRQDKTCRSTAKL